MNIFKIYYYDDKKRLNSREVEAKNKEEVLKNYPNSTVIQISGETDKHPNVQAKENKKIKNQKEHEKNLAKKKIKREKNKIYKEKKETKNNDKM